MRSSAPPPPATGWDAEFNLWAGIPAPGPDMDPAELSHMAAAWFAVWAALVAVWQRWLA